MLLRGWLGLRRGLFDFLRRADFLRRSDIGTPERETGKAELGAPPDFARIGRLSLSFILTLEVKGGQGRGEGKVEAESKATSKAESKATSKATDRSVRPTLADSI